MTDQGDTSSGLAARRLEVEARLNEILDPCSVAVGSPIGLVQMGIVEAVEIDGDDVAIKLLPTFPGCLYTAVFAGEIERSLSEIGWLGALDVELVVDGSVWDEDRMAPAARISLERARDERRRRRLQLLSTPKAGPGQLRHHR